MFKDGQVNKCSQWRAKWSAICSEWWSCSKCWPKVCERQCFTISELLREFPQILCTVLYKIITIRLGYHKFCQRQVPKMFMSAHKMKRMASVLIFLEWYHTYGNEFLSHVVWVTGDETWVSFVNVETKEQTKQWMHTFTKLAKKV
jgi:hypothetical protein